jgi:hypothetical protein
MRKGTLMKPVPFVPIVAEISASNAGEVPGLEEVIHFWTGGRPAGEWFEEVNERWGTAGFVLRRGGEALGFTVYGPPEYLPISLRHPAGPPNEDAAVLAYVGGDTRTRRHLLVRSLRELRRHGVRGVEALASDPESSVHSGTRFLLESGWRPVRRAVRNGRSFTLLRVDLGSAVEVGELARGLIGKVRIPRLGTSRPIPEVLFHETRARRCARDI